MKKAFMIFIAVFALMSISFAADAGVISIHNATGFDIYEIYISDSGTEDWEEDVLGADILENGETLRVTVYGSYRIFDLAAVDHHGNEMYWYEFPGNISQITIYRNGTAEYR